MGPDYAGAGLNNKQYGALCEIMGTANHMEFAAQATNCASPGSLHLKTKSLCIQFFIHSLLTTQRYLFVC
jgi:hypothetical protein